MICNNERVRQPACSMGARGSADEAMNKGKLLQADWENFTRDELLAELTRLQAEIARLTALLPATLQAQASRCGRPGTNHRQQCETRAPPYFRPSRRYRSSGGCFAAARMSIRYAGKAAIPENPATRRRAPTNGAPGSAKSPASGAPTAGIVYC